MISLVRPPILTSTSVAAADQPHDSPGKPPLLIETIFTDRKAINMTDPFQGSDTQAFIEVIDGVRHHVPYFLWIGWLISYLIFHILSLGIR